MWGAYDGRITETQLVVISGPIGSGKSSVAQLLAVRARAEGRSAAVVELDRLYLMLDDASPMDNPSLWSQARRAAGALATQFAGEGMDLVIVEGDFWTPVARQQFLGQLHVATTPTFVTLRVAEEEALRRVQLDTDRRASRNPDVLHACHMEFAAVASVESDLHLDTTSMSLEEVAAHIAAARPVGASDVEPVFRDVDCLQIPVPDVEAGLAFYRDALGHALIWRTSSAAGLRLAECAAELVVQSERPELEANLSVASVEQAVGAVVRAGGTVSVAPFDIAIGRCAVVQDPWGNRLVLLDHRHGRLVTDTMGNVQVDASGRLRTVSGSDGALDQVESAANS